MVTWTFDLLALFIGFTVGLLLGGLLFAFMEMRDGGAWAKGFFEGCEKGAMISYFEHEKERMRGFTKSQEEVKHHDQETQTETNTEDHTMPGMLAVEPDQHP